jgi:transcriptional regulator with XRE-family HTH domain
MSAFHDNVRLRLNALERSQEWLRDQVGVSSTTVSAWINGNQEPRRLDTLIIIADKLGVTVDELIRD